MAGTSTVVLESVLVEDDYVPIPESVGGDTLLERMIDAQLEAARVKCPKILWIRRAPGQRTSALIGPVVVLIIVVGNSAVIIGLWIAHFLWTYYCVARTKKLGLVLKIVALLLLPVPLILWTFLGIVGSLLGGIGYGFFAPLISTFEAVGENVKDKFYHCFVDGCWSTLEGSCTVVRDFTDFCFHSYFANMDDLIENLLPEEKPIDIK